MIEKIKHKKNLYALIVRKQYRKKKGINFFTSKEDTQQFGYMKHKKNHVIMPHRHNKRLTKVLTTTEVILLFKGMLRVDFYNDKEKYPFFSIKYCKGYYLSILDKLYAFDNFFKSLAKHNIIEILDATQKERDILTAHPIYSSIKTISDLRSLSKCLKTEAILA